MKSIGIIGSGNVAQHLAMALKREGLDICWIFGRNEIEVKNLASMIGTIGTTSLPSYEPDLVLVCVSDDAVQDILRQVPNDWNLAYTSGAVSLQQLSFSQDNVGVFYPLQTFSKERDVNFSEVPVLIEANNSAYADELFQLAKLVSKNVHYVSSDERKSIHLAAVFCNNFVNHLLYQSNAIMINNKLDFQLLLPLIEETIKKAKSIGPEGAQTGPAKRNDQKTIQQHLQMMEGNQKDIYQVITNSIIETYKNA